jgi:hypothetical protein
VLNESGIPMVELDEFSFEKLFLFCLLPLGAWAFLIAYHWRFPSSYLLFQAMPYLVTILLCHRYGKRHFIFWDDHFFSKKYVSFATAITVVIFVLVLSYFTWVEDVSSLVDYALRGGRRMRARRLGLIFPFVLSGYVLPFLLFPHVVTESLSLNNNRVALHISIALMMACCLVWVTHYLL